MHFILLRHHNVVHILLRIQTGLEAYVSIYLLCRCNMPAHSCADVQTPSNKHFLRATAVPAGTAESAY